MKKHIEKILLIIVILVAIVTVCGYITVGLSRYSHTPRVTKDYLEMYNAIAIPVLDNNDWAVEDFNELADKWNGCIFENHSTGELIIVTTGAIMLQEEYIKQKDITDSWVSVDEIQDENADEDVASEIIKLGDIGIRLDIQTGDVTSKHEYPHIQDRTAFEKYRDTLQCKGSIGLHKGNSWYTIQIITTDMDRLHNYVYDMKLN